MDRYEGWSSYETLRLYTILSDEWEYSDMIVDYLNQWAEQGYSKSDARKALYDQIYFLVEGEYLEALDNISTLVKDLIMKDLSKMDIDYDAITDRFMEDYDDIMKRYNPKASNNRKSGTSSGKNARPKAPAKRTAKAAPRRH